MNNKNNNQFCTECGTKIEGGNYCPNCGTKIDNEKNLNNIGKKIIKGLIIGGAFLLIAFIILIALAGLSGAFNYPDHAYTDNIDGTTVYIPAGYKHINTKDTTVGGQVLKTATYKNKQGKTITVSAMNEGEMYIMGHGKKVPTGNTIKNPDGSSGILKQRGNNYLLVTSDDTNILQSI